MSPKYKNICAVRVKMKIKKISAAKYLYKQLKTILSLNILSHTGIMCEKFVSKITVNENI